MAVPGKAMLDTLRQARDPPWRSLPRSTDDVDRWGQHRAESQADEEGRGEGPGLGYRSPWRQNANRERAMKPP
jgi:hypothetical protein